jgi:hypothetical protein
MKPVSEIFLADENKKRRVRYTLTSFILYHTVTRVGNDPAVDSAERERNSRLAQSADPSISPEGKKSLTIR